MVRRDMVERGFACYTLHHVTHYHVANFHVTQYHVTLPGISPRWRV